QQELAPWPRPMLDRRELPRIAGISSFGAGGANAHVVIEEYVPPVVPHAASGPALIVLSARHEDRLREQVQLLLAAIASNADIALADLAYTLQVGREAMEERLGLVVNSLSELREKLGAYAAGETVIDELYRGQVKRNKDALAALAGDDDMGTIVEAWIAKGKFGKLLDLWVKGLAFDWQRLYGANRPRRISLPTYPFARERYWIQTGTVQPAISSGAAATLHPLLHRNTSDVAGLRFSTHFSGEEFFLADHVVQGARVLPGVAQLEMARSAASEAIEDDCQLQLKNIAWMRPVTVDADGVDLHIALYPEETGDLSFEIYSEGDNGEVVTYSQGSVIAIADADSGTAVVHDLSALRKECTASHLSAAQCYARFEQMGLHYGPGFQGLSELFVGSQQVLARVTLPTSVQMDGYVLHPSLLDAALQATLGLQMSTAAEAGRATLMLPFALGALEVLGPCTAAMWAVVRHSAGSQTGDAVQRLDVDLCDELGAVCVRFTQFSLRPMTANAAHSKPIQTLLLQPTWTTQPALAATGDAFAKHVVLLCGVDAVDLEPHLPDAICLEPANGNDVAHRFEAAAGMLLEQIQSLGSQSGRHLIQVVVPSHGMGQTMVGLGGMLRTAQLENPRIVGQVIRVESGQDIVQALLENRDGNAQQVRYVDGERQIGGWAERPSTPEAASPWKAHGVYLITGGAGGLGLIFAREIASQARNAVLILTGRSAPNEGIQANIRHLETLGAVVRYHAVDVTDAVALTQLVHSIPEEFESLDGIIHSAGVVRDSFIAKKTRQQLHDVLSAKVAGTLNLDEASRDMTLDCFICFSSIAGAVGNVGQADYAAANAFMDAFAHHRAELVARGQRHGHTLSVNWPLWDEGGMQADAATRTMLIQQLGMHALATDSGVLALRQALASGLNQLLVVAGDAARIRQVLLGKSQETVATLPSTATNDSGAKTHQDDHALQDLVKRTLMGIVSSLIKVKPEDIDGETALSEYGFDSISLTEFGNALNQHYRLELKPTIFFEYPTLDGLAGHLVREYPTALAPQQAVTNSTTAAHAAAAVAAPMPAFERIRSRGRRRFGTPMVAPAASRTQAVNEPIAIVGMSGQFPQARDIDAFWRNLRDGKDCIGEIPPERGDWQAWYGDRAPEENKTDITWGGFIDGVDEFDPMFFGISPKEAELMDPQQRLMMTHVWKALEDAGYAGPALSGSDTAIYVGTMASGYGNLISRARAAIEGYSSTGAVASVGPNRMSYFLNFHGPSEPVETACSSSLVALRRAILAIERGDCGMAIAGGVNTIVNPELHISFNKAGMLSEDGRCKTFSSEANGYVRGEGVAMLVLKTLSAAERDGDHIYGLVRGTAENHGGRANSLTAPNPKAQAAVVRKAHQQAGIDPRTVTYIEAHGTGTPLGDPVEINGLKAAFKELYAATGESDIVAPHCGLGSVKTNIGHLELAAGVAGVVKILLQMKHKTLVKSLHSDTLNPYIDLNGSPFYVVQEAREWAAVCDARGQTLPRRAGVSSFGFGGVNAHVVLEEYIPSAVTTPVANGPVVVVLSARNEERLREQVQSLLTFIDSSQAETEIELTDLAYTLQVGREAMEERLGLVVGSLAELRDKLTRFLAGDSMDEFYRGQVRRNKDAMATFSADEDMAQTVRSWVEKGKFGKLLDLWVKGYGLDWTSLYANHKPRRISLPTYSFARESYWVPIGDTHLPATSRVDAVLHPLIQRNSSNLSGPRFSSRFGGDEFFLADHVVLDSRILPGVAQLEMARFAANEAMDGTGKLHLKDVVWSRPVVVGSEGVELHVSLYPEDNGDIGYQIHSGVADGEIVYGRGVVTDAVDDVAPTSLDLATLRQQCTEAHLDAGQCYAVFDKLGLHYGDGFRGLSDVFVGEQMTLARITLPASVRASKDSYVLHPSLLDAALQASIGLQVGTNADGPTLMLPFSLGALDVLAPCTASMWALVRPSVDRAGSDAVQTVDIDVCDDDGVPCLRFRRLGLRVLTPPFTGGFSRDANAVDAISQGKDYPVNDSVPLPPKEEAVALIANDASDDDVLNDIRERATRYFVRFLSTTLKLPTHRIDPRAQMETYGIDSLLVLDLTRALEKQFGPLPKTLFFEYQTIAALSGYFVQHHHAAMAALLGESRAVAAAVSVPSATKVDKPASVSMSRRSRYETHKRIGKAAGGDVGEIAIIGVAGRYPQAGNLEQFWANLSQGKDSITEIPSDRWDHTLYYDEDRTKPGKTYGKWGGFIDGVDLFDPLFFNISPREAELMDPQERLFLECVHGTLEDAGYTRDNVAEDSNVGVFVGVMYEEYQLYGAQEQARGRAIAVPGHPASIANRISYFCNFNGPSMALDTMCSSSLTAIHLACQSL
ncbi:SDR family NAD(P)-dependent oxidoreductase, partial [Luteibacter rhizovicinus]|uniref:SDR family NAD(P)-dependent oxidoreductase n=1 Tax=Luteibacter rhizovicinus TaxID=242606 RepID=UPI00104E2B18